MGNDLSKQILSDLIVYMKYAKYNEEKQRRETWTEIIDRNKEMHFDRFPKLREEIENAYRFVYEKKILPSMRMLQFSGKPIKINPARGYNCSFVPIDNPDAFSEIMFLLLSGTGTGYSTQFHHIESLPIIRGTLKRNRRYLVGDSIEGWADAVKTLMYAYFYNKSDPQFDFSDIRPKGALLLTAGGKAPGAQPLKDCVHNIRKVLDRVEVGEKLTTLQAHDIICYIADSVLSGGIRRASCINFFSLDDEEMLTSKYGAWWVENPQRARANNSVVLLRHRVKQKDFSKLWEKIQLSNAGEPGFYFSNDKEMLSNPCAEASLKRNSYCNLCEINVSNLESQADFEDRARAASFIGTLQASYTNFHYLRDEWQVNTEKSALLGIGLTGIASGCIFDMDLEKTATIVVEENKRVAKILGIKQAARTTLVKPSGTSSLVLGCSSGIHAFHAQHYIRRIRIMKNEPIYSYLKRRLPKLIEDDFEKPHLGAIISIPIKAPTGAILRHETPIDLLSRVKLVHDEWIKPGHVKGSNTHNVSCTVSIKDSEWEAVGEWLWKNRNSYNGISAIPYDGGSYTQQPFEEINREQYEELYSYLKQINLSRIKEEEDNTDLKAEAACSGGGGSCEISLDM